MTLRKTFHAALFLAIAAAFMPLPAHADPKPVYWTWWPWHWDNLTFKPYLEPPKGPQNAQWDDQKWDPADWAAQMPRGAAQVIEGFYRADIISDQYVDDHIPVLEVGPSFYALSGYDKRRVLRMIDSFYKITSAHKNGMFTIADWRTHEQIGLYTAAGAQLQ